MINQTTETVKLMMSANSEKPNKFSVEVTISNRQKIIA